MSFVSMLEDLIDEQNVLDHFASAMAVASPSRSVSPPVRDAERREKETEAERYYRSQIRLVQRFIDFYKQERQLLDHTRTGLPKHLEVADRIGHVLQSVVTLKDWADDEARWHVVTGVEKQLNRLIRDGSIASALSPKLLEHLEDSAKNIVDQAEKLKRHLKKALQPAIDPSIDSSLRDELGRCAILLDAALPRFEQDCLTLSDARNRLHGLRDNWNLFLELYTTLPLRLQRRLTIKELSRLNLHEEQERFVSLNHSGCFQLGGVSGSGKTIILVNRALRLANERPEAAVYVLTINRSLAVQLRGTLEVVNRNHLPDNLNVMSLYDLFQSCIAKCSSLDNYRLTDDRSGERIDRSWNDFVGHRGQTARQNVFAEKSVAELIESLTKRIGTRPAAIAYLREEVQCVQSAYLRADRQMYFEEERMGRVFALGSVQKRAVLNVVQAWEEWLATGGLSDIHTVSLTAAELLNDSEMRGKIKTEVLADAILVDEAQDLSTVELIALRNLLRDPDGDNALFLTGDVCQKVYSKHQAIEQAGFSQTSVERTVLRKNFRNTKEILSAAFRAISAFPPPESVAGKLTRPEVSPYSGSKPLAVNCAGVNHEEYIREVVRCIAQERVAVVTENPNLLEGLLEELNKDTRLNCVHVQSNADIDRWREIPTSPTEIAIFLSSFDAVKGFEFDTVIVADASVYRDRDDADSFVGVPPFEMLDGDFWRCATKYYAACTRARNHLIVTYVEKPSIFLKDAINDFDWIRAEDRQLLEMVVGKPRVR